MAAMADKLEKQKLVKKLELLNKQNPNARVKWWSFCKVHAEGQLSPTAQDVAFLETFFASFDAGDIQDEPGCPFSQGGGKESPADLAKKRVFVGGLPKGSGEAELRALFEPLGAIARVEIKMDENNQSRGFGFVNFQDVDVANFVTTTNKEANVINGKWIDCKLASETGPQGGNPMKGQILRGPPAGGAPAVAPAPAAAVAATAGWGKGGGGGGGFGSTPYGSNGNSWGGGGDSWSQGGGWSDGGKGGKGKAAGGKGKDSWGNGCSGGGDSWGGDSWSNGGGFSGGSSGSKDGKSKGGGCKGKDSAGGFSGAKGGCGGFGGAGKDAGGKGGFGGKDGGGKSSFGGKEGGAKGGGGWGKDSGGKAGCGGKDGGKKGGGKSWGGDSWGGGGW